MADTPPKQDFYNILGMNVDVNPFEQQDSECNLLLNFYSRKYGSKKVRFGYTRFLDNPDNSPVRNLYFYQFPSSLGLIRVSGGKTYVTGSQTGGWGTAIPGLTWTRDVQLGISTIAGAANYVVLSNSVDGQYTYDGTNVVQRNGSFTPKSQFLISYQSRILGDVNQLSLAESYVSYNLSLPPAASGDPYYFSSLSANPAQGGTTSVNAGSNGNIVGMSVVQNTALIYKQRSVVRYDGANFLELNFQNTVVPGTITTSDLTKTDLFLSYNSIYSNDAQTIAPASFGINTIIRDTFTNLGVTNPLSFSFDYLNFFWIGTIWYQPFQYAPYRKITNAMLVRDERFREWYIWSVGHVITAFGSYTDSLNVRHMVTGDSLGNTYVWGEQYSSDNGTAIDYELQTKYIDHGKPSDTKVPQLDFTVAADPGSEAKIYVAKDFSEQYKPVGTTSGFYSKFSNIEGASPSYKTLSLGVKGSTTNARPEIHGWSFNFDIEERHGDPATKRDARK